MKGKAPTICFLARRASPGINTLFKYSQLGTSMALALSHGTNNAQRTVVIIAMAVVTTSYVPELRGPWWLIR